MTVAADNARVADTMEARCEQGVACALALDNRGPLQFGASDPVIMSYL